METKMPALAFTMKLIFTLWFLQIGSAIGTCDDSIIPDQDLELPEDTFCFIAFSDLVFEWKMRQVAPSAQCIGAGKLSDMNMVLQNSSQQNSDNDDEEKYGAVYGAGYIICQSEYSAIIEYARCRDHTSFVSKEVVIFSKNRKGKCVTIDVGPNQSSYPCFNNSGNGPTLNDYVQRMANLGVPRKNLQQIQNMPTSQGFPRDLNAPTQQYPPGSNLPQTPGGFSASLPFTPQGMQPNSRGPLQPLQPYSPHGMSGGGPPGRMNPDGTMMPSSQYPNVPGQGPPAQYALGSPLYINAPGQAITPPPQGFVNPDGSPVTSPSQQSNFSATSRPPTGGSQYPNLTLPSLLNHPEVDNVPTNYYPSGYPNDSTQLNQPPLGYQKNPNQTPTTMTPSSTSSGFYSPNGFDKPPTDSFGMYNAPSSPTGSSYPPGMQNAPLRSPTSQTPGNSPTDSFGMYNAPSSPTGSSYPPGMQNAPFGSPTSRTPGNSPTDSFGMYNAPSSPTGSSYPPGMQNAPSRSLTSQTPGQSPTDSFGMYNAPSSPTGSSYPPGMQNAPFGSPTSQTPGNSPTDSFGMYNAPSSPTGSSYPPGMQNAPLRSPTSQTPGNSPTNSFGMYNAPSSSTGSGYPPGMQNAPSRSPTSRTHYLYGNSLYPGSNTYPNYNSPSTLSLPRNQPVNPTSSISNYPSITPEIGNSPTSTGLHPNKPTYSSGTIQPQFNVDLPDSLSLPGELNYGNAPQTNMGPTNPTMAQYPEGISNPSSPAPTFTGTGPTPRGSSSPLLYSPPGGQAQPPSTGLPPGSSGIPLTTRGINGPSFSFRGSPTTDTRSPQPQYPPPNSDYFIDNIHALPPVTPTPRSTTFINPTQEHVNNLQLLPGGTPKQSPSNTEQPPPQVYLPDLETPNQVNNIPGFSIASHSSEFGSVVNQRHDSTFIPPEAFGRAETDSSSSAKGNINQQSLQQPNLLPPMLTSGDCENPTGPSTSNIQDNDTDGTVTVFQSHTSSQSQSQQEFYHSDNGENGMTIQSSNTESSHKSGSVMHQTS